MQRVAIGRALVREPALYLMDEPLSSLDAKLRNDLRLELKRIQQDLGATMLYVTHDQVEALTHGDADRRARARPHGAGRHARADLRGPADQPVASRLGSPRINLVPRALFADWPAPRARRRSASAPSTCACAAPAAAGRALRCDASGASSC